MDVAWAVHEASVWRGLALDHFILFSSSVSVEPGIRPVPSLGGVERICGLFL